MLNPLKADPTRTTSLRGRFVSDMHARFRRIQNTVFDLIVTEDAFGLNEPEYNPFVGNERFKFHTNPEKILAFQQWFKSLVDAGILGVVGGQDPKQPWLSQYTTSAYKTGLLRAYVDSKGVAAQQDSKYVQGSKAQFMLSAFAGPVGTAQVQMLATRSFEKLKAITTQMSSDLSSTLAEGLAHGYGARKIAASIRKDVEGIEKKRALVLARTEVVHAYAEGQLDAFESLGVEDLGVNVEWSTAGDDRVCPQCASFEGKVFTPKSARGLIPKHPNCRCAWIPSYDRPSVLPKDTGKLPKGNLKRSIKNRTQGPLEAAAPALEGHVPTGVMRWMGQNDWSFKDAKASFTNLGVPVSDATIRAQLAAGKKGERGAPANVTQEQAARFLSAARGGVVVPPAAPPIQPPVVPPQPPVKPPIQPPVVPPKPPVTPPPVPPIVPPVGDPLGGNAPTAVMRWMGTQNWTFAEAKVTFHNMGITVSDATIRAQLAAGKKGQRGAPAVISEGQNAYFRQALGGTITRLPEGSLPLARTLQPTEPKKTVPVTLRDRLGEYKMQISHAAKPDLYTAQEKAAYDTMLRERVKLDSFSRIKNSRTEVILNVQMHEDGYVYYTTLETDDEGKKKQHKAKGLYWPANHKLEVNGTDSTRETGKLRLGGWAVKVAEQPAGEKDSIASTFIHEYGHAHYYQAMTILEQREWDENFAKLYPTGYDGKPTSKTGHGTTPSTYGTSSKEEYFAECFVAYTHKEYKSDMLQKSTHELLTKFVGERPTTGVVLPRSTEATDAAAAEKARQKAMDDAKAAAAKREAEAAAKYKAEMDAKRIAAEKEKERLAAEAKKKKAEEEAKRKAEATKKPTGDIEEELRKLKIGVGNMGGVSASRQAIVKEELVRQQTHLNGFDKLSKFSTSQSGYYSLQLKEGTAYISSSGAAAAGTYNSTENTITLAAGSRVSPVDPKPKTGGWVVGNDLGSLYRHEYGHHHYEKGMTYHERLAWNNASQGFAKPKDTVGAAKWDKDPSRAKLVSVYGSSSKTELYAESFSAYTSPAYVPGSLPKPLEDFLKEHVGERKVAVGAPPEEKKPSVKVMASATMRAHMESVLGRKIDDHVLAGIVGGVDGTTVTVDDIDSRGEKFFRVKVQGSNYVAFRTVHPDYISNDRLRVDENKRDGGERITGKGTGTKVFKSQVDAAVKAGFKYIETQAAGFGLGDDRDEPTSSGMNGYYTWARLGYDTSMKKASANFDDELNARLKRDYPDAKNLSDIMATPSGRDWWKRYGTSVELTFDLSDNSKGRKVLDAYVTAKGY